MPSINEVTLMGHLGRDSEIRHTGSGKSVTSFSIATQRSWKDASGEWKKDVDWHNVTAWSLNESIAQRLVKGSLVLVKGRLQTRSYEAKDGTKKYVTEVIADMGGVMYLRDAENSGDPSAATTKVRQMPDKQPAFIGADEDVPF